jgi:transcriptional regulator with XRE-family HTH domain
MDIHKKLRLLLDERGWTEYRLSKESGLSESTIANIFRRNATPSFSTLEAICGGLGITLSQFFAEHEMVELTPELKELFDGWAPLTVEQKKTVLQMEKAFSHDQNK